MQNIFPYFKKLVLIFVINILGCTSIRIFQYSDIPSPNGPHLVGTKVVEWIDTTRFNLVKNSHNLYRKIIVQIWYPGQNKETHNRFSYFGNDKKRIDELAYQYGIPKIFLSGAENIKTRSQLGLEPEAASGPYPLIIFSHGRAGYRHQNSIQCEELASRGYIVIAVNHTYDSYITIFEDGSIAPYLSEKKAIETGLTKKKITTKDKLHLRSDDLEFALKKVDSLKNKDRLFGLIDLDKIGMFGQSFGGATIINVASKNDRIDAIAGLDTWFIPLDSVIIKSGVEIPFLHLGQDKWIGMPKNYKIMKELMNNSSGKSYHFASKKMGHYDFTDGPQFAPPIRVVIPYFGSENRNEMRSMLNTMLVSFFDKQLKNKNHIQLDKVSKNFHSILAN